ncbi:DUF2312 domain-containing protein [Hyphomicrobium sp. MC1]|uniref:DUF2312 domain-containing protein n=1 Tax=Hyphomicrobium sp. (strain MC1) TaxID=717785 RepID=UPI000213DA9F|nr:DUF2312 domain-containing protein [Hyphomicrobium sp. MC1]CCB64452.1 protein of unknown function [Hyphomicrobium sp. MC1]
MTQIVAYARELADNLRELASVQERVKDLIGSAKDAGINVRALRKVAREMVMESDKREKLYEDEEQLCLFRTEVGLTTRYAEAAE